MGDEQNKRLRLRLRSHWLKRKGLFLGTARKVSQIFYLFSLLGCIQDFYLSVALGDILGRSTCRPRAFSLSTPSLTMLFLLLVHYLVQGAFINASPIPSIDDRLLEANHCTDLTHCRTIWSIIWSSLVTIFSCTWVAVHPNILCPKKREANSWVERCIRNPLLSFAEHRLPLFVCALLVPEYVLAWSIRQFLSAQRIATQNKGEFNTLS